MDVRTELNSLDVDDQVILYTCTSHVDIVVVVMKTSWQIQFTHDAEYHIRLQVNHNLAWRLHDIQHQVNHHLPWRLYDFHHHGNTAFPMEFT